MKIARYGQKGSERPAIIKNNILYDIQSVLDGDFTPEHLHPDWLDRLANINLSPLPAIEINQTTNFAPPVSGIGNIVCVGLNYSDHAKEGGFDIPTEPVLFCKHTGALCGARNDVVLPPESTRTDYEIELCIVIGQMCANITPKQACDYIAGYTLANDISERRWQTKHGGQWVKGKSYARFAPVGHCMVTADEITDPQSLQLELQLNGQTCQKATTSQMIFDINFIISYISRFMTLLPGDLVFTGTPAGVGFAKKRYLQAGDALQLALKTPDGHTLCHHHTRILTNRANKG